MNHDMRLISKAGKTFYFATFWLARTVRSDAARAYDFCRTVDDIADANPARPDRDTYLHEIRSAALRGDTSHDLVRPLASLLARFGMIREPLADLVEACQRDRPELIITDEGALESYAHGVAGNVGLIMYPILGGRSPLGRSYAADLGIAMQYTNIARDVIEDLRHGRSYLPTAWLSGITLTDNHGITPEREAYVVDAVRRLLRHAEERYLRGLSGLHYLAAENRFAIRVAAQCYRAIGERVLTHSQLSRTRAVVSMRHKVLIACKAALEPRCSRLSSHQHPAHQYTTVQAETAPSITGQVENRYKTGVR